MSVATQLQTAIAGAESLAASMKTFALQTDDQNAKKEYQQLAQTFENALQTLNNRMHYIQEQEPQYKES